MNKNIQQMVLEVVEMFQKYESTGTKPWTPEIAAKDLSYQVGSLTKLFMQRAGERYAENQSEVQIREKIGDELADILAEVLFIAHKMEIDLGAAWEGMLVSDAGKIKARQKLDQ